MEALGVTDVLHQGLSLKMNLNKIREDFRSIVDDFAKFENGTPPTAKTVGQAITTPRSRFEPTTITRVSHRLNMESMPGTRVKVVGSPFKVKASDSHKRSKVRRVHSDNRDKRHERRSRSELGHPVGGPKTVDFNALEEEEEDKENMRVPMLGQPGRVSSVVDTKPMMLTKRDNDRDVRKPRSREVPRKVLSPLTITNTDNVLSERSTVNAKRHWCSMCKSKDCYHLQRRKSSASQFQKMAIQCPSIIPHPYITQQSSLRNQDLHAPGAQTRCSMCKTSSCSHLQLRMNCRSPCDGASSSPTIKNTSTGQTNKQRHSKSLVKSQKSKVFNSSAESSNISGINYDSSVDLSGYDTPKQASKPFVFPASDILRRKLDAQLKAHVLNGVSLRGLDGTDLSTIASPKVNHKVKDVTQLNINDISCIEDKKDIQARSGKVTSVTSLRERPSNSNLAGALHSTLNYPLHSTLNYPLSSTVSEIDAIPKDLSFESEASSSGDCSSSMFSFDVDESSVMSGKFSVHTRPAIPGAPSSGCHVQGMLQQASAESRKWEGNRGNGSGSLSYSGSDTSICDNSVLFQKREVVGCESQLDEERDDIKQMMTRQTGQFSLQEAHTSMGLLKSEMKFNESKDVTLTSDWENCSVKATRDSKVDLDMTVMPGNDVNLIDNIVLAPCRGLETNLGKRSIGTVETKLSARGASVSNMDLDQTVQTGCMGLLKRTKVKTSMRRKSVQVLDQLNENNSPLLGSKCHGYRLVNEQKKPVRHSNSLKSCLALGNGHPKRKYEQLQGSASSPAKRCKSERLVQKERRICKRAATINSHVTPKKCTDTDRRLSQVLRNTPGMITYELDSQLNVIRSPSSSSGLRSVHPERKRELVKKMREFNRTLQDSGRAQSVHTFGHL